MSPLKAIQSWCRDDCMNHQPTKVKKCRSKLCTFYNCRSGKNDTSPRVSALQLIKRFCLDCSDINVIARAQCKYVNCILHQYRKGHNPALKGKGPKNPFVGCKSRPDDKKIGIK